MPATKWQKRVDSGDWDAITAEVNDFGGALLPRLLTKAEAEKIRGLYPDDHLFRATIDMRRYRFGEGEYRYFQQPYPQPIQALKQCAVPAAAADRAGLVDEAGPQSPWPDDLDDWLDMCHKAGQKKSTAILLKYGKAIGTRLHRDLYGDMVFPLQVVINLSEPGVDHTGGEFLLVEQRPRAQSRGTSTLLPFGHGFVFTTRERPVQSTRGWSASPVRHGVSAVRSGERLTLGLVFHDAREHESYTLIDPARRMRPRGRALGGHRAPGFTAGSTAPRRCGRSPTAATSGIACSSPTNPPPSRRATGPARVACPSGTAHGRQAPSAAAERSRCRSSDPVSPSAGRFSLDRLHADPLPLARRRGPVMRRPLRRWGIRGGGASFDAHGGGPAWSTISNSPPGSQCVCGLLEDRGRSNGSMECRNCAEIRSKVPSGKPSDRSCWRTRCGQPRPRASASAARALQRGIGDIDRDDVPAALGKPQRVGALPAAQIERTPWLQRRPPRPDGR